MKKITNKVQPKTIAAIFTAKQVKKRCNTNLDVKLGDTVYINSFYPGEPGIVCEIKNKLYPSCDIVVTEAYTEEAEEKASFNPSELDYIYDDFGDKIFKLKRKLIERCYLAIFKDNKTRVTIKTDLDLFVGDFVYVKDLYSDMVATIMRKTKETNSAYEITAAFGYPQEEITKDNFNEQMTNRGLNIELIGTKIICSSCNEQAFLGEDKYKRILYTICPKCGIVKTEYLALKELDDEINRLNNHLPKSMCVNKMIDRFDDDFVYFRNHKVPICKNFKMINDALFKGTSSSLRAKGKGIFNEEVYNFNQTINKIMDRLNYSRSISYFKINPGIFLKQNFANILNKYNICLNLWFEGYGISVLKLNNLPDIFSESFYTRSNLIIKNNDDILALFVSTDIGFNREEFYIDLKDGHLYHTLEEPESNIASSLRESCISTKESIEEYGAYSVVDDLIYDFVSEEDYSILNFHNNIMNSTIIKNGYGVFVNKKYRNDYGNEISGKVKGYILKCADLLQTDYEKIKLEIEEGTLNYNIFYYIGTNLYSVFIRID